MHPGPARTACRDGGRDLAAMRRCALIGPWSRSSRDRPAVFCPAGSRLLQQLVLGRNSLGVSARGTLTASMSAVAAPAASIVSGRFLGQHVAAGRVVLYDGERADRRGTQEVITRSQVTQVLVPAPPSTTLCHALSLQACATFATGACAGWRHATPTSASCSAACSPRPQSPTCAGAPHGRDGLGQPLQGPRCLRLTRPAATLTRRMGLTRQQVSDEKSRCRAAVTGLQCHQGTRARAERRRCSSALCLSST